LEETIVIEDELGLKHPTDPWASCDDNGFFINSRL